MPGAQPHISQHYTLLPVWAPTAGSSAPGNAGAIGKMG